LNDRQIIPLTIFGSQPPRARIQPQAAIHLEALEEPPRGQREPRHPAQPRPAHRHVDILWPAAGFQQDRTGGNGAENSKSVSRVMAYFKNGLIPNRYPIHSGSALEPTTLLGPRSPETPKHPDTWCLGPM
jgi:hypothetical protein